MPRFTHDVHGHSLLHFNLSRLHSRHDSVFVVVLRGVCGSDRRFCQRSARNDTAYIGCEMVDLLGLAGADPLRTRSVDPMEIRSCFPPVPERRTRMSH